MNEPLPPATHNRDAMLMEWDATKKALSALKDKELKLRKEIVAMEFAGAAPGTQRVQLGNGYALKAVVKYNYKITNNEAVEPPDYSHLAGFLAMLPTEIAKTLIRWTPELSESVYKKLTAEEREIVNKFVLITDGASALEIEEPKKPKGASA